MTSSPEGGLRPFPGFPFLSKAKAFVNGWHFKF
jgi:hypothetical protein